MIEGYFKKRENLVQVFVLIDSRHGPQKNDLEFISQLDSWGIVFTLVFTKIDKEKPGVVKRNVEAFFNVLKESWQFLPRHFVTSAELKTGRPEMLAFIDTCNEAATTAE
jgi:GTP-binding protein